MRFDPRVAIVALAPAACSSDSTQPDEEPIAPFSVEFVTTAGDFTLDVTPASSPIGARHFRDLVAAGYYDGNRFFRVVPGFVVQFGLNGDPTVTAMYRDEIRDDPVIDSNVRGSVTFAKTNDPNSRTTQLFINYTDNSFLDDSGFSPFATVRGTGMDVIDGINAEYGEAPDQERIESEGNVYLDASFPNLDYIETAAILPAGALQD